MHWGDDRGQSIQIGAVLLFGALIVALAGYQAFVVPQQNERVEFDHSQTVQNDMQDLRNALASATGDASTRSVSVQLGTRYPARVVAVNPGPPSGSLRTAGTSDSTVAFEIGNAEATGETGDFWTGLATRRYPTGALVYQPNYNLYGGAPTTVYEHSALVNDFRSGTVPLAGQAFIEGRQITLVALNGSLDTSRSGTASVDVRPVSASTRTVTVTNRTDSPVRIELPTRFERPTWADILADQQDNGYVEDFDVVTGSSFNTLVVELTPGENYTLRLAKAGVGTRVGGTDPAYMTRVTTNETAVPEEGTGTLVVEVRDAYNNPVSGVNVAGEASLGRLVDGNVTTDGNGRATFRYRAPSVGSETITAVEFSYPDHTGAFDAGSPEDVRLGVTIQNTKGEPAGSSGSGDAPFSVTWNSPSQDRGVDVGSEGDTLDMQAAVEDATAGQKLTVEGANVDFAVNNSTVATLSPNEAVTDAVGTVTTQLTAEANGTVRVYAVSGGASDIRNVTFTNVTGPTSGAVDFRVDDLTFVNTNNPEFVASYDVRGLDGASSVAVEFANTESPGASETLTSSSLRGSLRYTGSYGAEQQYDVTIRVLDGSGDELAARTISDAADAQNPSASNDDLAEPTSADLSSYEVTDNSNTNSNKVEYQFDYTVSSGSFDRVELFVASTSGNGVVGTVERTATSGTNVAVPSSSDSDYGTGSPYRVGYLVYDADGAVVELVDATDTADGGNEVVLTGAAVALALLGVSGVRRRRQSA